jgi:mannose-6-phosphate isomerase
MTEPSLPSSIFKLQGTVKNYDWGSREWLPAFLGRKNTSRIPWAELWLEVDPSGLNYEKLPFLFKVLATEKPLSIQVHPNLKQAKDGFERENREGIPIDAPNRNYRDSNNKNEILCALSPFVALCGFREQWEISALMEIISIIPTEGNLNIGRLVSSLKEENPYKTFLTELYRLETEVINALTFSIKSNLDLLKSDFPEYKSAWELCVYLSNLYPEDPGVFAPLFLNIVELDPGCTFLPVLFIRILKAWE